LIKITAIVISVLLVFSLTTYFFAREVMVTQPGICKYCHFIEPFYNKWERSTHNMVPCLKCHEYGPLNALSGQLRFILGTYNPRPLTNVPDSKCLQTGCHQMRLIESKVIFTRWNIVFDHKPHFTQQPRGINLHCRSCHSDIVQGEHMKVSINVCFLCHLNPRDTAEPGKRCTVCHSELKVNVQYKGTSFKHIQPLAKGYLCSSCHTSVMIGAGRVSKEKCFFCHIDRTERFSDLDFIHRHHVTKKQIACFFCHELVEHGDVKLENVEKVIEDKAPERKGKGGI
jgi:hypothetical protein